MNPPLSGGGVASSKAPNPAADRGRMLDLIRSLSLQRGRFVLASGAISDVYLDLRLTTTSPEGAHLAARFLLSEARRLDANRVGGPTLGADPLVGAAVALSLGQEPEIRGFLVRSKAKDHGTERRIEGHLGPGDRALILDDVVTAGGSILRAVEAVREVGAEVVGAWCLVDRGQGGREALQEVGVALQALFPVAEVLAEEASGRESARPPSAKITHPAAPHGWEPRTPLMTVDAILVLEPGKVLLVERRHPPPGWALPGGFVERGESAEEALRREVLEETGLVLDSAAQMHTYSAPGRDPRLPTASVVFVGQAHGHPRPGDDAGGIRLFPLDRLPQDLCFDHRQVIEDFRTGRFSVGPARPL